MPSPPEEYYKMSRTAVLLVPLLLLFVHFSQGRNKRDILIFIVHLNMDQVIVIFFQKRMNIIRLEDLREIQGHSI